MNIIVLIDFFFLLFIKPYSKSESKEFCALDLDCFLEICFLDGKNSHFLLFVNSYSKSQHTFQIARILFFIDCQSLLKTRK